MKINATVKYGARNVHIPIAVGGGTQSFKWLALNASHRFAMLAPRGRVRQRDDGFAVSRSSNLLPRDVYTDDCPFFHPEDRIDQHLADGDDITVELYDRLPVDEYGSPVMSKWSVIAFCTSDERKEERDRLVEEKMLELECVRRRREAEERKARLDRERPQIQRMGDIMKDQLHDEAVIEETMGVEWNLIRSSGVLDKIGIHEESEEGRIRDFFLDRYAELSDMYKFYSAINSGGGTHTLEYIEFSKFLCETDIFQADESSVTLKIFIESQIQGGDKSRSGNIHQEIHQYEFFVSLVKIGIYKYVTLAKKKAAMLRKKGHIQSHSKASTPTHSEALLMLYEEFLKPVIERLHFGTSIKVALGSDEVLLLLHKHLEDLSKLFCGYAECDEEVQSATEGGPGAPPGMINVKQFTTFATDAGFLGYSDAKERRDEITAKDVRQIFSASQHDTAANDEEIKLIETGGGHDSHQEQMVFSEFLEAIARLGVIKWSNFDHSTHLECIRRAVESCCALVGAQEAQERKGKKA